MNLCNINHKFNYELEKLCRLFLPFEKITVLEKIEKAEIYAVCTLSEDGKEAKAELFTKEKAEKKNRVCEAEPKAQELALALCLYDCFSKATEYTAPWGILTGVRPIKLYHKMCDSIGEEKTKEYFKDTLLVSESKIELCADTMLPEYDIIKRSRDNSFSLYISIPFCPTRCAYCSFVSHSVDKAGGLIEKYVPLLCRELAEIGKIVKELNLYLQTVYIGGGTPVALNAKQLTEVMNAVKENFDLEGIEEYTVEAGRPDAIDEDKLKAIKENGATRISINPQTMNDSVLKEIGRNHTAEQTAEAFALARKLGFDNINMDLIAGLPTETFDSFKDTIDRVLEMDPESVTVHSLSMKRASNLSADGRLPDKTADITAAEMVDFAREKLKAAEVLPYYLYRQSKTVGNLENVGYAKKGYEGLYNVYIMDETHTILAAGASGVTKLRRPSSTEIERIYNYKYPYEYIDRFDEILNRKKGITAFYEKIYRRTIMDFYDVVDMAKKGFDKACKTTESAVNISKQRLDQASLESKLSKSYEILGKYCYDTIINNGEVDGESVKPIIDDIAEKLEQIKTIKAEILKAKSKKVCSECGAVMAKDSAFCSKCGAKG